MIVSVMGLGFVGGSMKKSFELKGCEVKGYDKFIYFSISAYNYVLSTSF